METKKGASERIESPAKFLTSQIRLGLDAQAMRQFLFFAGMNGCSFLRHVRYEVAFVVWLCLPFV